MHVHFLHYQTTLALQHSADIIISFFHRTTNKVSHFFSEAAVGIDRTGKILALGNNAMGDAHTVIILTEGRGLVDNTSTTLFSDVVVTDHTECLRIGSSEVIEEWSVLQTHQLVASKTIDYLIQLSFTLRSAISLVHLRKQLTQTLLKNDKQTVIAGLVHNLHIGESNVHTQSEVTGQSPGSGGPC